MFSLTARRISAGLSKAQLARRADLDQSLLSKIESGRVRPYPKQLQRLARALGVSDPSLLMAEAPAAK